MRWFPPVVLLFAMSGCAEVRDATSLHAQLSDRFGKTQVTTIAHDAQHRLELLLTDRRWRGLNSAVPDSAKVIARYALERLPEGMARPDTIAVSIRVHQGVFSSGTSTVTYGVGEL